MQQATEGSKKVGLHVTSEILTLRRRRALVVKVTQRFTLSDMVTLSSEVDPETLVIRSVSASVRMVVKRPFQCRIQDLPSGEFGPKTYYLSRFLLKNCIKMKEIGPKGGFLRSANDDVRLLSFPIIHEVSNVGIFCTPFNRINWKWLHCTNKINFTTNLQLS